LRAFETRAPTAYASPEDGALKAILHHATRDRAQSQNKTGEQDLAAHIRGRIARFAALDAIRGEKP